MCGIIGVINSPSAAEEIFLGLQNLQHRGQDGGGIATWDDLTDTPQFRVQRGSGLVDMVFPIEKFRQLKGSAGIGHTRYSTTGSKDACLLQPFISNDGRISIAHNGNILNHNRLAETIKTQSPDALETDSDTEVILYLLSEALNSTPVSITAFTHSLEKLAQLLIGSYSVVGYIDGLGLIAFRDPNGLRPLMIGHHKLKDGTTATAIASESTSLEFLGYTKLEEIQPGEVVVITPEGKVHRAQFATPDVKYCMFEWVYFSRVESTLNDLPVYRARFNLGLELAKQVKEKGLTPDIVVAIPETSRIAAISLAEAIGVPFREGLIKNRYINRTFILDSQSERLEAIRKKLTPVSCEVEGKSILLVDDSIVRGNTALKIIDMMRKAGAKEIYLASTCPPIKFPCFYGVDFPDKDELIAGHASVEELNTVMKVDALIYQSMDGLIKALDNKPLCHACLTGDYPTNTDDALSFTKHHSKNQLQPDDVADIQVKALVP